MENLWKKFREETKEDMEKIINFLDEISFIEKPKREIKKISKHLVLDKETVTAIKKTNEKSRETSKRKKASPRKKIYGKLTHIVKDLMEKENLSRAQAYRIAKKRMINNF